MKSIHTSWRGIRYTFPCEWDFHTNPRSLLAWNVRSFNRPPGRWYTNYCWIQLHFDYNNELNCRLTSEFSWCALPSFWYSHYMIVEEGKSIPRCLRPQRHCQVYRIRPNAVSFEQHSVGISDLYWTQLPTLLPSLSAQTRFILDL